MTAPTDPKASFLTALSSVATAAEPILVSVTPGAKDEAGKEDPETEGRKAATAKKKWDPADIAVTELLASSSFTELPGRLTSYTAQVNTFLLAEIAPRQLAMADGCAQSPEALKRYLDPDADLEIEIDKTTLAKLREFAGRAANLKLARFAIDYFDLPESDLHLMLNQAHKPDDITTVLRTLLAEKQ